MSEDTPFALGKSKYNQNTFVGRLRHFLDVIDPRLLFINDKKLNESINLLKDFEEGKISPKVSNSELWAAQKIKQAIIHPDTGEKIPMPFRMSGFVPFGSPIVVGMIMPTNSLLVTSFWQWFNQSLNAGVNFSNRNATQETSTSDFLIGYTGAVTSAVSIAVGIQLLIRKSTNLKPTTQLIIKRFIPFPATATANVCNVMLMRRKELTTGIEVTDSQNKVIGVSQVAAKKALGETSLTRLFLPMPILLIPSTVMSLVERTSWYRNKMKRFSVAFQSVVVVTSFFIALPIAIALFPQFSSIHTNKLEDEIQNNTSEPVLYYNKGL